MTSPFGKPLYYVLADDMRTPVPAHTLGDELDVFAAWMSEHEGDRILKRTDLPGATVITAFLGMDEAVALAFESDKPLVFGTLTSIQKQDVIILKGAEEHHSNIDEALAYHDSEVRRVGGGN